MSKQEVKRRFISVGTKLAVATVVVLAGLSVILLKELTQRERRRLIEAKAVAGSMVTDLFAASCAAPIVFADNDAVTVELEKLRGNRQGQYSIRINDQFRICFEWRGQDAFALEITDYH